MCKTCGCNYANYQHRPDEMKTTMGGSYKGIDKVVDAMPKQPSVPAMPRTTKKGK